MHSAMNTEDTEALGRLR